ncbi:MAG TPA: zf-HC2 domain-containing protein [Candidatus Acidoferrales bacterium]|jgi:anti-sigma factor RsiW|nr:zf-HC2 domain-containing protein [Candidatus Acidoferrales bacterium]
MPWSCEQVEARLSDYVDRLLGPAEREALEQHARGCARCAALLAGVTRLVTQLHSLEPLEAPPRLVYTILDRTLGSREKTKAAWLGGLRTLWHPRFVYGAVSVLITAVVLFQALGFQWHKPTLSDLNPVHMYRAMDRRAHLLYARGARFVTDLRVVYEIQSRLRLESEPQPPPEPKSGPGQSNGPRLNSPRRLDRAYDANRNLEVMACILSASAGRSN